MSAYCETCAAIGNVYWKLSFVLIAWRIEIYYDVLGRSLYNGLISGGALDGGGFFDPDPLESIGQHKRQAWFGCACCPSNVCRFIPSLPGYIYAVHDTDVYVNLYMSNASDIDVKGRKIQLVQTTAYPWSGNVKIAVDPRGSRQFALKLRVPGWVKNEVVPSDLYRYADQKKLTYTVKVNGTTVESTLNKGYFSIERK